MKRIALLFFLVFLIAAVCVFCCRATVAPRKVAFDEIVTAHDEEGTFYEQLKH